MFNSKLCDKSLLDRERESLRMEIRMEYVLDSACACLPPFQAGIPNMVDVQ